MKYIVVFCIVTVVFLFNVSLLRWILKLDHILKILEQTAAHLEDIKQQNKVVIKQQDSIIELLEDEVVPRM